MTLSEDIRPCNRCGKNVYFEGRTAICFGCGEVNYREDCK